MIEPMFDPEYAERCGVLLAADFVLSMNSTPRLAYAGGNDLNRADAIFEQVVSGLCSKSLPVFGFSPKQIDDYRGAAISAFRSLAGLRHLQLVGGTDTKH